MTDSCFVVKDLPKGASYVFRVGCITKTGAGPFSDASVPVVMPTYPEGKTSLMSASSTDGWLSVSGQHAEKLHFDFLFLLFHRGPHSSYSD